MYNTYTCIHLWGKVEKKTKSTLLVDTNMYTNLNIQIRVQIGKYPYVVMYSYKNHALDCGVRAHALCRVRVHSDIYKCIQYCIILLEATSLIRVYE